MAKPATEITAGAEDLADAIRALAGACNTLLNHKILKRRAVLVLLHDLLPLNSRGNKVLGLRDLEAVLEAILKSPTELLQRATVPAVVK